MKIALYLIGLTLISLQCALAQSIKDPIKDPIKDYLASSDDDKDSAMPYFKTLLVLKCDVDNSGKPSILISFNGYGGRQGNFWTAYLPSGNGYIKADDGHVDLTFRRDTFFVGSVGSKYGLLAYAAGKGGGDLNFFQFINGQITEQKIGSLDLSKPQDKQEFENYFGTPPNWKSLKNYPARVLNVHDLKGAGYDPEGAIQRANVANHPLKTPIPNDTNKPGQ